MIDCAVVGPRVSIEAGGRLEAKRLGVFGRESACSCRGAMTLT